MCTEDNELNVEILKELLKIESAECTICENGEKILEEFEYYDLGEYDMILMDVQMPVVNGFYDCQCIFRRYTAFSGTWYKCSCLELSIS